jgi:selenocysteine-specific elongation factor
LGTSEVLARVVTVESDRLEPGRSGLAQVFLREPAVASWNQAFVMRSESPMTTIAGGRVLVPDADKLRRPARATIDRLRLLRSDSLVDRGSAAAYFAGSRLRGARDLVRIAGIDNPLRCCLTGLIG